MGLILLSPFVFLLVVHGFKKGNRPHKGLFYTLGNNFGKGGGGETVKPKSQTEIAEENLQAQINTAPGAAKVGFDILSDPNFGLQPTTQLFEDTRRNVFGQESQIRDQLLENILGNLVSPTGISQDQQQAIDARRGNTLDETTRRLRERANLGGNLFGGRSQAAEQNTQQNLLGQFAEEDIAREERSRLNAIQAAIPALQILFPDVGLTTPQFQNPVPSASVAAQADAQSAAQQNAINQQRAAQNQAFRSSLFSTLGGVAGSAFGPGGAFVGSQAGGAAATV